MSEGCLGELKRLMDSQNPKYSKYDQTSDFLPVPPNHQNDLKWTKSSDPMYGGSNELFGRNKNFPLVSNIKLHLKMSVNYQLQISPPPTPRGDPVGSIRKEKMLTKLGGKLDM